MKKAFSVVLALVMIFGVFSVPLNYSFASTNTFRVAVYELNVRDDVWGSWIGSIYKDQQYTTSESKKDSSGDVWYAISFEGKNGWVHGDHVTFVSASGSSSGKLTVTTDVLNVREKVWGSVVSQVFKSEVHNYTETSKDSSGDTWYKISKGWVHGDFVKLDAASTPPAAPPPASATGKLTVDTGALRVRTSAWGEYLTTVYKGNTYEYFASQKASDGSTWFQIEVNGKKGYVHGEYVVISKPDSSTSPTTPTNPTPPQEQVAGKVKVNTDALNVRNNVWGSWIATVLNGEVYEYLSTAKDSSGKTWYKIKVGSSTGWVHGDFVKVETSASTPPTSGGGNKTIVGSLEVTTSVLNVRDAVWGKWIGQTYNSTTHHYYSTAKDSSGNTWFEIGFAGGSGWIHGDFVSLDGTGSAADSNVVATASSVSNVYALEEFTLEVRLKDSAGKALTGRASRLSTIISGAERPSLVSVGSFREVSSGVYRATAKISDSHQSVKFTFTLDGKSLGETATVNSTASEFQERWLDQNVGVYMNLDGVYGYQCKDVLDYYANDMFGNFRNTVGRGDAADLFDGASDEYFIKIRRESSGPNSIPKMGDVIIYSGGRLSAGHLSVVISATATSIRVLEQNSNGSGSTPAMYDVRSYSGYSSGSVIGWLRPRVNKIKNSN